MLANAKFKINCARCSKESAPIDFDKVKGRLLSTVIANAGFRHSVQPNKNEPGDTYIAYCSNWCKWRHGRTTGIHTLLNRLGL